ncbi:MAG: hypothetical protein BA872_10185 [Desulfobacterales bacterium C00003060]|nr:MAG: hypothetical protein BA865_11345 [Desulfobacterales bacterium S5133MH4]OEU81527.1 MAG: hypothetical protein BA872_10185 [Desulfobacterales bacterium C00003060]
MFMASEKVSFVAFRGIYLEDRKMCCGESSTVRKFVIFCVARIENSADTPKRFSIMDILFLSRLLVVMQHIPGCLRMITVQFPARPTKTTIC